MLHRAVLRDGPVLHSNAFAGWHDVPMAFDEEVKSQVWYRVGIDVGTHSTGFCAVEVDSGGMPLRLLNSMVFMHDSGIDPDGAKKAETRKAMSGAARRTRRLYRTRRSRLADLDRTLTKLGYPIVDLESLEDPRAPWFIRAQISQELVRDDEERRRAISVALRHIARHRGWRNPYSKVDSLLVHAGPSEFLVALIERVSNALNRPIAPNSTPGEVIAQYLTSHPTAKLRGPEGILSGKLHQSDNAQEIRRIGECQGLGEKEIEALIRSVFQAKSPRGSAQGLRGKDALPGQERLPRAERAHPVFQLFRIVGVLANLRIREDGMTRALTPDELRGLTDFLLADPKGEAITWGDLADNLGIERSQLRGTAAQGPDGAAALSYPPKDVTDREIRTSKIPWLVSWWTEADEDSRGRMVDALSNSGGSEIDFEVDDEVAEVLEQASEEDQEKLEKLALPSGRAAYSLDSMRRLTSVMLERGVDLHEARKIVFKVDDSWRPPAEPIGAPVGNPAVDRVTKQVARWLNAAEKKWGVPESINIEHVRDALGSERAAREAMRDNERRHRRNQKMYEEMHSQLQLSGRPRRSDLIRYQALQRQNGQCLYCGDEITFITAEIDHIVPRAGAASTNTRTNLAAVCRACNHSKGKLPFAVWANSKDGRLEVSLAEVKERVRMWNPDSGMSKSELRRFQKEVLRRLTVKNPDEAIDARSMESVAWMANELRHRIEQYFLRAEGGSTVSVYRGALTAEARKASGFENRVNLIGGGGKTRFDRRHHAMDALVIALMNPSIAQTLALRMNLRDSQRIAGKQETWKGYHGEPGAATEKWLKWDESMRAASELFNLALAADTIPILENIRLRQGSGAMHEAGISKLKRVRLGDALSAQLINRASTPALWTALTRCPDYDEQAGLPEDDSRQIVVNGRHFGPDDVLEFFDSPAACVAVRGGYAQLGASIHHARIYRIEGKKPVYGMLRVYQVDLVKHRKDDLFTVSLPVSSISVRTADAKVRKAIAEGTAIQIAWLVEGDELKIDVSAFGTGTVGELVEAYPMCTSWRVAGFPDPDKLRLRPYLLSREGIPEESSKGVREILEGKGWRPAVNKLFQIGSVHLIRRTVLGTPRVSGRAHLPSSVEVI